MKKFKAKSGGFIEVDKEAFRHLEAHPESLVLFPEAIARLDLPSDEERLEITVEFDRVVAKTACLAADESDGMFFAVRPGRKLSSRILLSKEPIPTKDFTVIAEKVENAWRLVTAYAGKPAPREPNDPYFYNKQESKEFKDAVTFWTNHGLCFDGSRAYSSSWEEEIKKSRKEVVINQNQAAQTIWDYMQLGHKPKKADAIFILGSRDERVAEFGAKLFLEGYAPRLIISGGVTKKNAMINEKWDGVSEADYFGDIARKMGVSDNALILERKAKNTGENIQFVYELLKERKIPVDSMMLLQKPYALRRSYATFMKQWPGKDIDIVAVGPDVSFEEYISDDQPRELVMNLMVGDLQRIKEYPAKGFQIEQEIPGEVWTAYEFLVNEGFTEHLL